MQSEVADFPEPRGQHMLEEAANELLRLQPHGARHMGAAFAIAHGNAIRVVLQDVAL